MYVTANIRAILTRFKYWISGKGLLKNTCWMLAAESVARISRLLTIVVLGLCLDPTQYGTAMLAIVCHDLLRVFTRVGSGAKVIQCRQNELAAFASNASTLQWLLCLTLTAIQIGSAETIANYYQNPELASVLTIMALSNLIYPLVTVRVFLVQRNNNMRYFASASASSVIVENLCTALLVIAGLGVMSVALAKLCSAVCWVVFFYRAKVTHYPCSFCPRTMKRLTVFASKILSSELLKSLRLQIDSLFAARALSPELFGLYSFAKSSGVGLSQSLSAGYLSSLYPYLCEQQRRLALQSNIKKAYLGAAIIAILFLIQAAVAPIYLDLLFGDRWTNAAVLVSILCLSAIPALCIDTTNTILRVQGRSHWEVYLALYSLFTLLIPLLLIPPQTAFGYATLVTLTSLTWLPTVFVVQRIEWRKLFEYKHHLKVILRY